MGVWDTVVLDAGLVQEVACAWAPCLATEVRTHPFALDSRWRTQALVTPASYAAREQAGPGGLEEEHGEGVLPVLVRSLA